MKASLTCFYAEHNSNGFICICVKYKTGMYSISKDKICWSSIFFPKNFPSLKKWLFHPFNNNFPHSPLGVLVGNENGLLLKGGNGAALREFRHFVLSKLEISDITNTAVDLAAQPSEASSGTPDPRAQQGEMNNSSLLPLVQIYFKEKTQRKGGGHRAASPGHSTKTTTRL